MASMLRNTVLWLSAIVTTGFGLTLLIAPAALQQAYGNANTTDNLTVLSRVFGAVTLAFSVLAIGATRIHDVRALRVVDATLLTGYAFIALVNVWNVYQFGTNGADAMLWTTIVGYVLFALAFAYLLFGEDMRAETPIARPIA